MYGNSQSRVGGEDDYYIEVAGSSTPILGGKLKGASLGSLYTSSDELSLDRSIMPRTERTKLCEALLNEISTSVTVFRPSASLSYLPSMNQAAKDSLPPEASEIDIVISGGGLKGYFMAGCVHVLRQELEKQNVKLARVAGASAGAWAGMFFITGFSSADWIETFTACQNRPGMTLLEAYAEIWPVVSQLIPANAYDICTGRLFISITEVTPFGLKNRMISKYTSNQDLFEACCASSTIPYVTERHGFRNFRGMTVADGGFSNNTPIFSDGVRRQLVFRLYEVEYPWRFIINPRDSCIEALALRGAILMNRFLQGQSCDSIAWLEKNQNKKHLRALIKRNYYFRLLIAPVILGGIVFYRGSGMSDFFSSMRDSKVGGGKGGSGDLSIIPFEEAASLALSPISYFGGVVYGALVDLLRKLNLLL